MCLTSQKKLDFIFSVWPSSVQHLCFDPARACSSYDSDPLSQTLPPFTSAYRPLNKNV